MKIKDKILKLFSEYKREIINSLWCVLLALLMCFLLGCWTYYSTTIKELNDRIGLLENELIEKENTIQALEAKLNERDWSEYWTKELLIKLVNNNKHAYYVRNEILYYNQNMSREEASYQALWIYAWSIENDVHPYLTTAVFVQESKLRHINGNGGITTSEAGARGIGQLMPVVEKIYGVDATIFEENVKGATLFLRDLQKMYKGDLEGILGHYNGGSRPYEKIQKYKETREYVAIVSHIYETMIEKYE